MFVTILSGHVSHENWTTLQKSFEQSIVRHPPFGLVESTLVQSEQERTLWHIISLWKSKTAFNESENRDEATLCVKLFCDAGGVPSRRGYEVAARYVRV
ncbi:MAG: hypothetical protein AB1453_07020 [Chloroflexota bacterium]|jgi:hypothetical protein